jgi:hypothetical protein
MTKNLAIQEDDDEDVRVERRGRPKKKPKSLYVPFFIRSLPRAVRDPFKAACASMDETMTSVIKRMMKRYVAQVEGRRKPNSSLLSQS